MPVKPVKINQGDRHILIEFTFQSSKGDLSQLDFINVIQKILKEWLFNVTHGREALTILIHENKEIEDSTIFDILKIVYQNNTHLGKSLMHYAVKNYKVGIKVISEGTEIEEVQSEVINLNSHNDDAGINKVWFNKAENHYIMVIKTESGCEVISTLQSEFEDLHSEYNIAMALIEDIIKNSISSGVDIGDEKIKLSWQKTYNNIVRKPKDNIEKSI